jgi:hypothetical protein
MFRIILFFILILNKVVNLKYLKNSFEILKLTPILKYFNKNRNKFNFNYIKFSN